MPVGLRTLISVQHVGYNGISAPILRIITLNADGQEMLYAYY